MIWTEFLFTSVSISKIQLKDRNRTDCRGRIRGAIAPVDDVTLRVQPLYESFVDGRLCVYKLVSAGHNSGLTPGKNRK